MIASVILAGGTILTGFFKSLSTIFRNLLYPQPQIWELPELVMHSYHPYCLLGINDNVPDSVCQGILCPYSELIISISNSKYRKISKKVLTITVKKKLRNNIPRQAYTKSLSNPPNPPAPFPEREGGDSPLLSGEGRGRGALIANRYYMPHHLLLKIHIPIELFLNQRN